MPVDLRHIYPVVMTPSHDGKYFQNYVQSLLNLVAQAGRLGMPLQVFMHSGESLITRARNNCVAEFLATPEWTHLFWIDGDIGFSADAAFRLLQSGYEVCSGVYPLKRENWPADGVAAGTTQTDFEATYTRYTVNTQASDDGTLVELAIQSDGFIELTEAPTGFMVIARSALEKLIAAYPDLNYVPDSVGVADRGLHYRFFDVMVDPRTRRYLSEDYGFCRLWSALGKSIYVDARSNLTHQGSKLYRGDFARSLVTSLPHAIGAVTGARMHLSGAGFLRGDEPPSGG